MRLDPNPAAVHLYNALRYGEAQAGAALLAGDGIVGLLEFLKQLGLIGSGNTSEALSPTGRSESRHLSLRIPPATPHSDFTPKTKAPTEAGAKFSPMR